MTSMKELLSRRLRNQLPRRHDLANNRWLRPIAEHVMAPELWRMRGETVARGVAVGMFWAFIVPIAQIIFATVHCVWWRANIPVAAAITFITNPLTVGGWLWLAYQVGSLVVQAPPPQLPADGAGLLVWVQSVGLPALVGMGLFATVGAGTGYVGVKLVWRLRLALRLRARARQRGR
ncbi:DUF2062 domain-containing protein [Aquabacterium sp. A7-Y]|uniref:DUF2062 domain-containing protein n=1 Tax=Aquabacterium sp. A7-Y TaxID=1349605 RepID=UPI00223E20DB|nr:DUF2062 domain-containing protein [Aquabacterium sp. A7-Y]MCW7539552.1 DUF2062 domain-containing protein [Aquabacterium sp. A7-Y]